ncbi:MAG: O-antigen ligase family protein [bacterium]|nr:O-antigen ligase family protein [bacterium]
MAQAPDRERFPSHAEEADTLARALEIGLIVLLVLAPLPFGSVGPRGRLAFELGSLALGAVWFLRALRYPVALPPRVCLIGLVGLIALGMVQIAPIGDRGVGLISPNAMTIQEQTRPDDRILAAETRLLGQNPRTLGRPTTLSVDSRATASAVRTGCALAVLLLVATTVGGTRGLTGIGTALLLSGGLQALYGILVYTSGQTTLLAGVERAYLDSATGTFVNRNHFAGYLSMALCCGAAVIADRILRHATGGDLRRRWIELVGGEGSRVLLLGLALVLGLAGLFLSMSRAGIALGLIALTLTLLACGRRRELPLRAVVALLIVGVALVPLLHVGGAHLLERYADSASGLSAAGGRARVWANTLLLFRAFPVAGSGWGTFAAVYPLFRSSEVRLFYAHAHNDWIQALAEAGVIGLAFGLLTLGSVLAAVVDGFRGARGTVAIGFAAGLSAMLLHALIDFGFHIPANAATAVVLAGGLFGCAWREPRVTAKR